MKTFVIYALRAISVFNFGVSLVFAWLFYVFYLKWIWLFEDGRYFDPAEDVVYHDTSVIHGFISLLLLLLAIFLWFVASKIRRSKAIN